MSWLGWIEDAIKEGADKTGDVVDAVVPDVVQDTVGDAVRSAPRLANPVTALPTALQLAANAGRRIPVPGARSLSNLIDFSANAPAKVGIPNPVDMLQQMVGRAAHRGAQEAGGAIRSGATKVLEQPITKSALNVAAQAGQLVDKPRQAVVTDMGDQAYYMATHNGSKPNHGLSLDPYVTLGNMLPDSFLTDWANDPDNWAQIKYVYEHGYDSNNDGRPDFQGGRAVWELYASKIGGVTKTLADAAFDPLSAVGGLGKLGEGISRVGQGAQIVNDASKLGRAAELGGTAISKTAGAIDRAGNLPFEAAGKVLGPIARPVLGAIGESGVGRAAGKVGGGLRDAFGLRETEQSIERRSEGDVTDVLGRTPNVVSETEIPDWAVSVPGTGRYEAVSNQEIRNFGGSYIVDGDGHPVPGSAKVGGGSNKQNQRLVNIYNKEGGAKPAGVANAAGVPTGSVDAVPGAVAPVEPDVPQTIQQEVGQPYADRITELEAAVKDAQNLSGIEGTRQAEFSNDRDTLQSMLDDLRAGTPNEMAPEDAVERIGVLHDEIESIDAQIDIERARVNVNEPNLIGKTSRNSRLYRLTQLRRIRTAELRELEYRTGQAEFLPSTATRTQTVPNPDFKPGPRAVVGQGNLIPTVGPNPDTAPSHYFQTPGERTAAIGEDKVNPLAARIQNAESAVPGAPPQSPEGPFIQNVVESQRGVNPDRAAEYDRIIGVDPATGQARPGSWAHRYMEEQKSISASVYPTFAEKTARNKLSAIEHTIGSQMSAFRSAFGQGMTPQLRQSAKRPINELAQELRDSAAPDDILADLMSIAVYSSKESDAKGALRAMTSWGKSSGNKWMMPGGDVAQRLAQARTVFRDQLKADLKPTATSQAILKTAVDPQTAMPVTPAGKISPPAFLPPETPQSVLRRLSEDMRVSEEDAAFLGRIQGNMDKPLIDEYYDRLMNGMTEEAARADIAKNLYTKGNAEKVRPGQWNKMGKKLSKVNTFARQNMQHNIANTAAGNIGDRMGNRMIMIQEGKWGALGKSFDPRPYFHAFGGPTKVKQYLSKETDPLLAGFGRDLPSTIVPEHMGEALDAKLQGNVGDKLIMADLTKNRGRLAQTLGGVVANQHGADLRASMETIERSILATNEISEALPGKLLDFQKELKRKGLPPGDTLRAIQDRATSLRAPQDFLKGKKARRLTSFDANDVLSVTGDKELANLWARTTNDLFGTAGKEARRVFFAGAKRYGIDDKLGQVFFFHFWASRALAQQAKAVVRSPRVLASYYRMINGAMHEADRNGYPPSFRGLMHYWGDTDAGFYGLWNPLGILVPAMMFSDLTNVIDNPDASALEKYYNRFSSIIPVSPIIQAAAAAMGITDDTPSITGTTRIQNIATDVANYANSHGIDLTHGKVIDDPVALVTQAVLQRVNQSVNFMTQGMAGDYEPYKSGSGKIDTIREVLLNNLEEEIGPKEQWTPEQWKRFQDAATSFSFGGGSNEDAKEAYREYSSASLVNRLMGTVMPQGSVLRYGPREQARNAGTPEGSNERDLATASPELLPLEVGQQYLSGDAIGTERQRNLYKDWNNIVYGVADADPSQDSQTIPVGSKVYTVRELRALPEDQRMQIADAFIASVGGSQELSQFKNLRTEYIASNPSLGTYKDWQGQVRNYSTGIPGFRSWASTTSPAFKAAQESSRSYYQDEYGLGGAALEAQLDDWATSPRAYAAFTGQPESLYDQGGGGAEQATQAIFQTANSSGGSSGSSGGSTKSIAGRIRSGLDSYQERMSEYQAAGGSDVQMPGLFGVGQEQLYGSMPEPSAEVSRYIAWAQRQGPGADTSPEAYESFISGSR